MGSISIIILSMKLFLMSAGVVSLATCLKLCVPFAVNEVPIIWSIITTWSKPPYIYIIINCIIIIIAATSRFSSRDHRLMLDISELDRTVDDVEECPSTVMEKATVVHERIMEVMRPVVVNDDGVGFKEETEISCLIESADDQEAKDIDDECEMDFEKEKEKEIICVNETTEEAKDDEYELDFGIEKEIASYVVDESHDHLPITTVEENYQDYNNYDKHETLEDTWKKIMENRHVMRTDNHMLGSGTVSTNDVRKELSRVKKNLIAESRSSSRNSTKRKGCREKDRWINT